MKNLVTFFAARIDPPGKEKVKGEPVELLNGFQFAVYSPMEQNCRGNYRWDWYVLEISSGQGVGHGDSKEGAIGDAKVKLNEAGEAKFKEMLSKVPILNAL